MLAEGLDAGATACAANVSKGQVSLLYRRVHIDAGPGVAG